MRQPLPISEAGGAPAPATTVGDGPLCAAVHAFLDGVWLLRALRDDEGALVDFLILDLNARAAQMAGVARHAVLGERLGRAVPMARRLGHVEVYARVVATGVPETMEFRYEPPDGPPVWREVQVVPVGDGVVLTFRDITRRVVLEEARAASDRDFRLLAENATDMISRVTPGGIVSYVSPACREVLGFEPHELVGRPAAMCVHPDDVAAVEGLARALVEVDVVRSPAFRARRKDGAWVWLESASRAVRDGRGRLVEVQVSHRDVGERAIAHAEHAALNRVFEAVAAGASAPELHDLVAFEVARLLGAEGGRVVRDADGAPELLGAWRRDGAEGAPAGAATLEAPVRLDGAPWGAVAADFATPRDVPSGARGAVERFAKLVGLAVANAEARERLTAQATTDGLTGLANHATFHTALIDAVALAERYGRPLSVAIVDLDRFKTVNDTLGHQAGDAALRTVASILRGHARRSDVVARIGGEELAWLMPETPVAEAVTAVERLRAAIAAAPVAAPLGLTASVGLTGLREDDPGPEALLARADGALYRAKNLGRNRVHQS
ncbi:MAG TPA: diguanylate cyclase [Miltoncostaeaceae bacterium]|jgi:diguanylate cyclase (GGDEF)-like protein/PAS domain S-box-containing protein|nr:diguanylate cyclase [Miltoncostaeaceae bacterium]